MRKLLAYLFVLHQQFQEAGRALLETHNISIRVQDEADYLIESVDLIMVIEPHVQGHDPQIGEFVYHREILKFTIEILEMHVVRVKLVQKDFPALR
jgi:hypothetical protein